MLIQQFHKNDTCYRELSIGGLADELIAFKALSSSISDTKWKVHSKKH